MKSIEQRRRFVELRGCGMSYAKIAEEIGVGRRTLIRWSKDMAVEINNLRAVEMESLREEYLLCRKHRIKVLGTQLQMVAEEILGRMMGDVETHRLFEIQSRLGNELENESDKMVFMQEMNVAGVESLRDAMKKVEKWEG